MAKRRKRTNKNVPAKGRLRDMADRLWSKAVIGDWGHKCAVCWGQSKLNAHHLIPRQHVAYRYDLLNGICLCSYHHQWCPDLSPHQNAAGWVAWLDMHHPSRATWYRWADIKKHTEQVTANAAFFCGAIRELSQYVDEETYVGIVGIRFAEYLKEHLA